MAGIYIESGRKGKSLRRPEESAPNKRTNRQELEMGGGPISLWLISIYQRTENWEKFASSLL